MNARTIQRHLSTVARAGLHTGNTPSHRSADGPVQTTDYVHARLDPARDERGRIIHPEPVSTVKTYKPGEVSRFAPGERNRLEQFKRDIEQRANELRAAGAQEWPSFKEFVILEGDGPYEAHRCAEYLSTFPLPAKAKAKPVNVMFDAHRYERSHSKAPRGRGLWLFEDSAGNVVFQHNGTLTEAKAAARTWAREHYAERPSILLHVCP